MRSPSNLPFTSRVLDALRCVRTPRFAAYGIVVLAAGFYAPPILTSVFLPFSYWDWLMIPIYQMNGEATQWGKLVPNLFFSVFQDTVQFRPVSTLVTNLHYLIFGGEFWLWYLAKWALFFACANLVFRIVNRSTGNPTAAYLALVAFLFHPMPFVADVMAQDAFGAFFLGLLLLALVSNAETHPGRSVFSLAERSGAQGWALFGLWMLAMLSREINMGIAVAVLAMLLWTNRKHMRSWKVSTQIGAFLLAFVFAVFRFSQIRHPSARGISLDQLASPAELYGFFRIFFGRSYFLMKQSIPDSPGHIVLMLGLGLIVGGGILWWRKGKSLQLIAALFAALAISILVTSSVETVCSKYLPIPVLVGCIVLGILASAVAEYWPRVGKTGVVAIAVLYPSLTISDVYTQYLGMQQTTYEMSDVIQFMEAKAKDGYALGATGVEDSVRELPPEKAYTFKTYFERYGKEFYQRPAVDHFFILRHDGLPRNPRFVLLTSLSPASIREGFLRGIGIDGLSHVEEVVTYQRDRYGFLENITGDLKRLEVWMGNEHVARICQAHPSRFGPDWPNKTHALGHYPFNAGPHFLYVFDKSRTVSESHPRMRELVPLRRYGAFGR